MGILVSKDILSTAQTYTTTKTSQCDMTFEYHHVPHAESNRQANCPSTTSIVSALHKNVREVKRNKTRVQSVSHRWHKCELSISPTAGPAGSGKQT